MANTGANTGANARANAAEERAILLACLEWQYEAGCDGWLASDGAQEQGERQGKRQGETQGWVQAESLVRSVLDSLSSPASLSQTSLSQTSPPPNLAEGVAPRAMPKDTPRAMPKDTPRDTPRMMSEAVATQRKPSQSKPSLLAPVDAVVEARKVASSCDTLEELEQAIRSFDLCPLKKAARNTVFAEGNPEAELVIVGEAPGRAEDEQGKPFVGESGLLLARMLSTIGIESREQYRITNLVYWRPPGNRQPDSDEVAVCYPFFLRHMALVKPRWLFLLGNVAMQNVLGERRGITKLRGQFFPITLAGIPTTALPSFHPSYLLRTPAKKAAAWHDLLVLRRAMQKGRMQEDGQTKGQVGGANARGANRGANLAANLAASSGVSQAEHPEASDLERAL